MKSHSELREISVKQIKPRCSIGRFCLLTEVGSIPTETTNTITHNPLPKKEKVMKKIDWDKVPFLVQMLLIAAVAFLLILVTGCGTTHYKNACWEEPGYSKTLNNKKVQKAQKERNKQFKKRLKKRKL